MSTEVSHYIEKRILNLLGLASELKAELPIGNVNFVLANQITRKIKMTEEVYGKAKETRQEKEFISAMNEVKKEMKETRYWLRILKESNTGRPQRAIGSLEDESEELITLLTKLLYFVTL